MPAGAKPRRSSPAAASAPRPPSRCARPPTSPPSWRAPLLASEVASLARRARVSLDDAPDTASDDPEVDRFGLTARELTVLLLVAEGHTNREIGESLFISEKTASVHVSRILAKLGVRSRVEAATPRTASGWPPTSAPGHGGRG